MPSTTRPRTTHTHTAGRLCAPLLQEDPKLIDILLNTKFTEDPAFKNEVRKQLLEIEPPEPPESDCDEDE